jgi:hypothetical protein
LSSTLSEFGRVRFLWTPAVDLQSWMTATSKQCAMARTKEWSKRRICLWITAPVRSPF